jgi:hypothetical protein
VSAAGGLHDSRKPRRRPAALFVGGFLMLTIDGLRGRVHRLNELCRGLAKETHVPKAEENDLLLLLERNAYRMAMHTAVEALENAGIVLATALQRMEGESLDRIEKDAAARSGEYGAQATQQP